MGRGHIGSDRPCETRTKSLHPVASVVVGCPHGRRSLGLVHRKSGACPSALHRARNHGSRRLAPLCGRSHSGRSYPRATGPFSGKRVRSAPLLSSSPSSQLSIWNSSGRHRPRKHASPARSNRNPTLLHRGFAPRCLVCHPARHTERTSLAQGDCRRHFFLRRSLHPNRCTRSQPAFLARSRGNPFWSHLQP